MGKLKVDWHQTKDNAKELLEWISRFPYSVSVDYLGFGVTSDPRSEWCKATFGQEYKRWTVHRVDDQSRLMKFYFVNDRDLTLFRLKWC